MLFPDGSLPWCDSQGWGPVNENRISLTPCFQNTVLLGGSAVIATIAFLLRTRHLSRHGTPHHLGHSFAYWPSQLALSVSLGTLVAIALTTTVTTQSAWFAIGSQLLAWILAIRLNAYEAAYEIRSSSFLFLYELYTIAAVFACLYSTHTQRDPAGDQDGFGLWGLFFGTISAAFFFEALPRGRSHVQLKSNANHHDKANLFSRLTFHYMNPTIVLGFRKTLTPSDIQDIMPKKIETRRVYQLLSSTWEATKSATERKNRNISDKTKSKTPSLLFAIGKTFFWPFAAATAMALTASALQFLQPMLIEQILKYIGSTDDEPKARGVILALGMLIVSVSVSLVQGQFIKHTVDLELEVRGGLVAMIYRKALVLSPESRNKASTGSIVNHMSTDAEKWVRDLAWLPYWFTVPFEIVVATIMLYRILGWSVFCGLFMIVVVTPFQNWAGQFFESASDAKYEAMDSRVLIMTELLSNIKNIKLYGYEPAFHKKVTSYRDKEVDLLRKSGIVTSFLSIVFTCLPLFMAFVSFAVYATVGGPEFSRGEINAQVIFVSMSLFALLHRPVAVMSRVIECTISLRVSTRRMQKFLLKEELDSDAVKHDPLLPKDSRVPLVEIENGTFAWNSGRINDNGGDDDSDSDEEPTETTALLSADGSKNTGPTLIDINVSFARGSMTALVGRVGQGKSSLLSALTGDMYKRQGTVKVYGSVAYVPQQAWIINATVRDNILFGKAFDQERYDRILFASGLLPDLEILSAGDLTEIGERGINLSGGQKQRVSLARAAYQDADVYLMDDPLSAVDAHVDQHLWEHLVGPNGLLKDKTRILVTHGIHHLDQVDNILVFNQGKIEEKGHYQDLMAAKQSFYRLINEFSVGHKNKKKHQKAAGSAGTDEDGASTVVSENEDSKGDDQKGGELVEDENTQDGVVGWDTFKVYVEAMSYFYFGVTIALYMVWEAFQQGISVWLEHWTRVAETTAHTLAYFLIVYATLVVSYMAVDVYLTYVCHVQTCVRASKVLHEKVLDRVVRLPMSFFDVTPQGRVLNRFSSDISDIDEAVPEGLLDVLTCASNLIGVLAILSFATPALLLVLPFLGLMYVVIQKYYIKTSSQLKRLKSISKSPLYQHLGETLNGISTIRAMGIKDRYIAENDIRSDLSANAHYASQVLNRWLNFRLENLTSIVVFATALFSVLSKGSVSTSLTGLALSNTMTLTYNVIWTLRGYCDLASSLVAVERVHEYSKKHTEAPEVTGLRLPQNWPQQGRIVFKNYSTRYREGLDLVLKNLSFEIKPAEKIGVVGRTGAGKSSLTLALFRIIEAADSYWARASAQEGLPLNNQPLIDGGVIEIDGVDISTLGLRELRQHLSIIPQEPMLFAGTVRENLDPFGEAADAQLWEALERAHLKTHISTLDGGLSAEVAQNGENFSVGQRSLICLARALLRKTKILILDEATAAVDVETDDLIQQTIRKEFKDRTILTIAHRIKTIMDSDRILVLDKGRIEEYDTPATLLKKKGLFHSLADQAGEISHH